MSVSCKTLTKTDKEIFQNERFVRERYWSFESSLYNSLLESFILIIFWPTNPLWRPQEIFHNERFVRDIRKNGQGRKPSKMSVSYETFAKTDKEIFQNERFVQDIRKNWQRDLPKWAFRTRHSQKLTKRPSKMSISYETFAKTDQENFQNERFIRDIRKNGQRDLPKWAFCTRHSQKLTERPSKMSVSCETFAKTDKKISQKSSKMSVSYEAFAQRTFHTFDTQRVDHANAQTQFRLGFAHPTRTISAKGWPRKRTNAVSPRFRASDTHDLRKGLTTQTHKRSFA